MYLITKPVKALLITVSDIMSNRSQLRPSHTACIQQERSHLRGEWSLCLDISCLEQISRPAANLTEYAKLQTAERLHEETGLFALLDKLLHSQSNINVTGQLF